jgi:alpha-L-fucosidase
MTINDSWAYRPKDRNFKSPDAIIRALIEVISRGGNLLLDVGPQPDGQIQPEFAERLNAVGAWSRHNAAAPTAPSRVSRRTAPPRAPPALLSL